MTHKEKFLEYQKKTEIEKVLKYKEMQRRLKTLKSHYNQSSENQNNLHSDILKPFCSWKTKTYFHD
jgi:hypothetical protein